MSGYVLAVDQSTQGTKGLLFDETGHLVSRADKAHAQLINEHGWVSHDPEEIKKNTLEVCRAVIEKAGIAREELVSFAITNQRETTVAWDRETGKSICNAIVWQCARAESICKRHTDLAEAVRHNTGLNLSPYFPASKMQWIMENVPAAAALAAEHKLVMGTIDSWLLSFLTEERVLKTDYSNASRTQLFNIHELKWDSDLCEAFKIPMDALCEVCMSDACFGTTTLGGYLETPIPIYAVIGDSHAALFGQNCRNPGAIKATYGTGSSVMMHIGHKPILSENGLVTSLAWGRNGAVDYVLEGNLNYTGAVISWLKNDVGLIKSDQEATELALRAKKQDRTYFVPAFTGLGAPYWDSSVTAVLSGITRMTGKNEIAKACLECIGYQITDLTELMRMESGFSAAQLCADGGPTQSAYLMQFQSDMAKATVKVPNIQELSGLGTAYLSGLAAGLYREETLYNAITYRTFAPQMDAELQEELYSGWKRAVQQCLSGKKPEKA